MADDDKPPLDGEVDPPGKKPRRSGPATGKGFGRQQTEEERQAEDAEAARFGAVALYGLDWRHPDWEPSDKDRQMVGILKFSGYTDEDVARFLGMSVESMLKYFEWEIANAKMAIIGDLANRAVFRARKGNDVLTMFLLKTRGGSAFSERAVQMQALGDALEKVEPDEARRVELVKKLTDALSAANRKKDETKQEKEPKE